MLFDKQVVPINRDLVSTLETLLCHLRGQHWDAPKNFNAIFIDKKGFIRLDEVYNPAPRRFSFTTLPNKIKTNEQSEFPTPLDFEIIHFKFCGYLGGIAQYRENC